MKSLNPQIQASLDRELNPGEKLLWADLPIPGRTFLLSFAIYFFAIPWTAFALFWESAVLLPFLSTILPPDLLPLSMGTKPPPGGFQAMSLVMALFGLPFVVIGFGMLLSPFYALHKIRRTIYGITDKRAFILVTGTSSTVQSFPLASLGNQFEVSERPDGSGNLYFSIQHERDSEGYRTANKKGFVNIPEVKVAERQLLSALDQYRKYG